ncbi:MAG: zinc-binding dehydrogenase [Planctomycetota bacterium]|jgi:NADPH:quinone reductase-like Zn-dependent oxidoreductase
MKAVVIQEHGGLDRVEIDRVSEPEPAEDEVILKVHSAGLNHLDIWVREGRPGLDVSMPHVMGSDAAGVVIAVGANVRNVNIGDEVILNPGLSTFAEQVAVPARNVFPKPSHMNFDEAGTFVLSYLTAWRMLMTRARLKPGQTVLIHGIGGSVALCALQLAKLAGAQVTVTSSTDEKLDRAGQIGADHTINYKAVDDVAQCVRDVTSGRGVDIVIDTVGAATWPVDFSAVRRGGKIVLCGVTSGPQAPTNLQMLYWNQLTVLGSTMGSDEDFRQMLKAIRAAKLKPVIDSVVPLEDVRDAMGKMEAGKQFGKIVLRVSQ